MPDLTIEYAIQTYRLQAYIRLSSPDTAAKAIAESYLVPLCNYLKKGYRSDARKVAAKAAKSVLELDATSSTPIAALLYAVIIRDYLKEGYGSDAVKTATEGANKILKYDPVLGIDSAKALFGMCIDHYNEKGYPSDATKTADKFAQLIGSHV